MFLSGRDNCKLCRAKDDANYDYQFAIASDKDDPNFIIEAKGRGSNNELSCKYKTDLQFNLSAVLGNDDGKFEWGRNSFQATGERFVMEENSDVLTGQLLDLAGNYQPAHVHLRERIKLDDRDNPTSRNPYRFLTMKPLESNTNVVKLVDLLRKDDPQRQMVYYQTGVGTYLPPGLTAPVRLSFYSVVDQATAWFLYQHVIDGYKFLMQTYRAGDRIVLFGFSRGAFTARALAGMLHSVGLLPAHNLEHVPFAYEVYEHGEKNGTNRLHLPKWVRTDHPKPEEFKKTFCVPVWVDFVGVWDTVASVGLFGGDKFPHISNNPSIMVFRHALALDERRGSFLPSLWDHSKTDWKVQDVREVWFRGEHCDVGGGSAGADTSKDQPSSMLSNISLRWMVRQIEDCKTGILFDHTTLKEYRKDGVIECPPAKNDGEIVSADPSQESIKLDKVDMVNDTHDSIELSLLWNFLEYFGVCRKAMGVPSKYGPIAQHFPNAKSGRAIVNANKDDPIYIHASVVRYMESNDYLPRARWYGYGNAGWPRVEDAQPPDLSLHNGLKGVLDSVSSV